MKARISILILAAFIALTGASPWEGAAATAPDGELPASGFFVATNSFPRNTVVDITNIETGKSTRVIVANTLDSPGLLAIVSREAAELIGMRPGSISRIRMVQPSDPIAYLRFTEGMSAGIPEYDSGHVITEENLLDSIYGEDTYMPPVYIAEGEREGTEVVSPDGLIGPSYVLEPEWQTAEIFNGNFFIFDEPQEIIEEDPFYTAELEHELEVIIEEIIEEELYIAQLKHELEEIVEEIIEEDDPFYIAELEEEVIEIIDEIIEEELHLAVLEERLDEILEEIIEKDPALITEYALVPAEERPPHYIYGIDPAFIIPQTEPVIPSEVAEPVIPSVLYDDASFSVPRVTKLDRGNYYVQVAAYDTPESVENLLTRIDHSYNPVVFKDGDEWYRILLGPMNQGESAAVLQRFKSIGYKDAFIRYAR